MAGSVQVLALNGSLRRDSYNGKLLQAARCLLAPHASIALWRELALLPPYNEDEDCDDLADTVRRLREAVADADALLVATPEYNATLPGALKNAIDWASRPYPDSVLTGKPAAVVGTSTGLFGAVWAQAEVRKALRTAGARVVERDLPLGSAAEAFAADGSLRDQESVSRLAEIVEALLALVRQGDRHVSRSAHAVISTTPVSNSATPASRLREIGRHGRRNSP
jgi:chromate reductase, NAD(P)H dehydrogenase (quinone)